MAPASLVFAWLLVTMRMVTSAVYLEPEEEGELTPHITQPGMKCQGSNKMIFFLGKSYSFKKSLKRNCKGFEMFSQKVPT